MYLSLFPLRISRQAKNSACVYIPLVFISSSMRLPTRCCFFVSHPSLHPASVFNRPEWGKSSSCEWDVPVIQCCLLFLLHCQLLSALTSVNSQPFLLLLRRNSAFATWSLSCMVLQCWRLSNYITCNITLGQKMLLIWCLPVWIQTQGCLFQIQGKDCTATDVADINQRLFIHNF